MLTDLKFKFYSETAECGVNNSKYAFGVCTISSIFFTL